MARKRKPNPVRTLFGPPEPLRAMRATVQARIDRCYRCKYGTKSKVGYPFDQLATNGTYVSVCTNNGVKIDSIVHMHRPNCPRNAWSA